jgi:CheY-like chemotaxis protein
MPTPPEKHRILVVDDNPDSANTMGHLLALAGFEVQTCFDGPSALAAADRFVPDACVLDIAMPGMDGYELARRLRERFPDRPPVLATMTAYGDYAHLERAADAGFDLQFTKPADPREVADQLKECVLRGTTFNEAGVDVGTPVGGSDDRSVLYCLLSRLAGLWSGSKPRGR